MVIIILSSALIIKVKSESEGSQDFSSIFKEQNMYLGFEHGVITINVRYMYNFYSYLKCLPNLQSWSVNIDAA